MLCEIVYAKINEPKKKEKMNQRNLRQRLPNPNPNTPTGPPGAVLGLLFEDPAALIFSPSPPLPPNEKSTTPSPQPTSPPVAPTFTLRLG